MVNRFVAFGEMYRIIGPAMPDAPDREPAKLRKPLDILYQVNIAAQQNRARTEPAMDWGLHDGKPPAWLLLGFGYAYFMRGVSGSSTLESNLPEGAARPGVHCVTAATPLFLPPDRIPWRFG